LGKSQPGCPFGGQRSGTGVAGVSFGEKMWKNISQRRGKF